MTGPELLEALAWFVAGAAAMLLLAGAGVAVLSHLDRSRN